MNQNIYLEIVNGYYLFWRRYHGENPLIFLDTLPSSNMKPCLHYVVRSHEFIYVTPVTQQKMEV